MKTRTPDLLGMSYACANMVHCPGYADDLRQYTTLNMATRVPREDFPPCDKRYDSEETHKEKTTRPLGKEISGAPGETNDCKSIVLKHTHNQDSSSSVEISAAAVLGKL